MKTTLMKNACNKDNWEQSRASLSVLLVARLLASTQPARSPGGNETDLATCRRAPLHRGRMTDVLVVSSSVRMLHRLHEHTAVGS